MNDKYDKKDINRIILAFHMLFALLGFCLTIFLGALIQSEISKLFWTAIASAIIFSCVGRYLAFIYWELVSENKVNHLSSQKTKNYEASSKGNIINVIQEAEKPKI